MQKRRVCSCQNNKTKPKIVQKHFKNHSHMFIIQRASKKSSIYAYKYANHNSIAEVAIQKVVKGKIISYYRW